MGQAQQRQNSINQSQDNIRKNAKPASSDTDAESNTRREMTQVPSRVNNWNFTQEQQPDTSHELESQEESDDEEQFTQVVKPSETLPSKSEQVRTGSKTRIRHQSSDTTIISAGEHDLEDYVPDSVPEAIPEPGSLQRDSETGFAIGDTLDQGVSDSFFDPNYESDVQPDPINTISKSEDNRQKTKEELKKTLKQYEYMPPSPTPFTKIRIFNEVAMRMREQSNDEELAAELSLIRAKLNEECRESLNFLKQTSDNLHENSSIISALTNWFQRIDPSISNISFSIDIPDVSPEIQEKIHNVERYLAEEWTPDQERSVLTVHVDEKTQSTIFQFGIAMHGTMFMEIPKVIRPDEIAMNSIRKLINKMQPMQVKPDPIAVINGDYPRLNYNKLFMMSRVVRAPSGDTNRLTANVHETAQRDKLSTYNTVIVNSTPSTKAEYSRVFEEDRTGKYWSAWGNEAQMWDQVVSNANFAVAPQASANSFLNALTQSKNVVVIVAHCDGSTLYMPAPPPTGTKVSEADLKRNSDLIKENKPFVYMFSCQAGNPEKLGNFASALLNNGASGVVASQNDIGSAEGQIMLGRILNKDRESPPIEDFWLSMAELQYFDMEVFLA